MIAFRNVVGLPAARLSRLAKLHTPSELWVKKFRSHTYSFRVPTVNVWFPRGANVKFSVSSMVFVSSWLPCENWSAPEKIDAGPLGPTRGFGRLAPPAGMEICGNVLSGLRRLYHLL